MTGFRKLIQRAILTALICGLFNVSVFAGENAQDSASIGEPLPAPQTDDRSPDERVDEEEKTGEAQEHSHTLGEAFAGYRFLDVDRFGGRAAEYDYLHSSPVFGVGVNRLTNDYKFSLDGNYLNDKDYFGDLLTDCRGEYRFHLRTESLFHNLDHEPLEHNFSGTRYQSNDQDPAGIYGIRVEQDEATFRYKLHNYPLHINLGYWRLFREGSSQQIFSDTMFEYSGANTINSTGRRISQETHEGNFGIDAHLGVVDMVYNFQIRDFSDNIATPVFPYVSRIPVDPADPLIPGGNLQHNENPDSRYLANTVRLHTSLDGGIVGAASYTYGIRENRSSLTDVQGANHGRDILQNAAGDFVYTPSKKISMALKVRYQEVDRDNPSMLFNTVDASTVNVRPSLDTQRDTITASISYRPTNSLTFKGEYKGDIFHRDNAQFWNAPLAQVAQSLPENTTIQRGSVAVLSRPLKGLSLKAQYMYSATDNPSYGASFGDKHEGQLFASYNSPNRWGATANYQLARENNNGIVDSTFSHTVTIPPNPPVTFVSIANPTVRSRDTDNVTVSLWYAPFAGFTLSGSYGFLRTRTDQGVLFGDLATAPPPPVPFGNTNYTNQAQIYSLTGVYSYNEKLDFSLAMQQVLSFSDFAPDFVVFGQNGNTAGIQDLSRTRTVENSLSARVEYHLMKNVSCTFDYSYRNYDEKVQGLYNGSVQAVSVYVSGKW